MQYSFFDMLMGARKEFLSALDASLGFMELDPNGVILNANRVYLDMSGYSGEELVGRNHRILRMGDGGGSASRRDFLERLRDGKPVTGVFSRQGKNGPFWIAAAYRAVKTAGQGDGERMTIIKLCIDVSPHVQSFTDRLARLEAVERTFAVAVYAPDRTVLSVNDRFITAVGCPRGHLEGRNIEELMRCGETGNFADLWDQVCSGHSCARMMRWRDADGKDLWLDSMFIPLFSDAGKLRRVMQISSEATLRLREESTKNERLRLLAGFLDRTGLALAVTDAQGKALHINSGFAEIFGYGPEEILGKSAFCVFGPNEAAVLAGVRSGVLEGNSFTGTEMAFCKKGHRLWVSLQANPIFSQDGKLENVVTVLNDVTRLKLLEILHNKAMEGMARNTPSERLLQLLCGDVEQICPKYCLAVFRAHQDGCLSLLAAPSGRVPILDRQALRIAAKNSPAAQAAFFGGAVSEDDIAGNPGYAKNMKRIFHGMGVNSCRTEAVMAEEGRVLGVVGLYRESPEDGGVSLDWLTGLLSRLCRVILEREESLSSVQRLSLYDRVTGLPNRDLLLANAERLLAGAPLYVTEKPLAVFCLVMDGFPGVCRTYSPEECDLIVTLTAQRLQHAKDEQDIAGRLSSGEFVLIVPDCPAEKALEKARRLQTALSRPCGLEDHEFTPSISAGISLSPENGAGAEILVSSAIKALSQDKGHKKGDIRFFSTELTQRTRNSLSLESRLRRALQRGRLHLRYQPQFYIANGMLYGVEALCRWNDAKFGAVSPARFIPLIEEAGLIDALSHWVLREACAQLGDWRKRGVPVPTMSVNLSSPNFHDAELPDRIAANLGEHGLCAGDLTLELTERAVLDEDPLTMAGIGKARDLGFGLSLDDFGTGYSSLRCLLNLPLSEIKLDRSFVSNLPSAETNRCLSQAVIHMGRKLNLTVLAEGVETMEQYNLLKAQQCHAAQGFLLARPMSASELESWLAAWRPHTLIDQHSML